MYHVADAADSGAAVAANRWNGIGLAPVGRTSYKTDFLRQHGMFDESLPGLVDVELEHRLLAYGLSVRTTRAAASFRTRGIELDEACRLAECQGRALVRVATIHPDWLAGGSSELAERASQWRAVRWDARRLQRRARKMADELGREDPDPLLALRLSGIYGTLLGAMEGRGVSRELGRPPVAIREPIAHRPAAPNPPPLEVAALAVTD
jgi:hypothetical protein